MSEYIMNICIILLVAILLIWLIYHNYKESFYDARLDSKELTDIQHKLKYVHENYEGEEIEQGMIFKYLQPNATVLELGGNIGRVALMANSINNKPKRYVVVESDPDIANQLKDNRNINNMDFEIVDTAISDYPLIQNGWVTKGHDFNQPIPSGWKKINTMTYEDLLQKYNIDYFDTFIVDCEGCFYDLIKNREHILENVNTLIFENDDNNKEHHDYLKHLFKQYGFKAVYCYSDNVFGHLWWNKDEDCFWEVLKKV